MFATTKEQYENQHRELMEEWKKKYGAGENKCDFAMDGIISPDVWFTLSAGEERILILLKEAYINI